VKRRDPFQRYTSAVRPLLLVIVLMSAPLFAADRQQVAAGPRPVPALKNLALEELANLEVITTSKQPERIIDSPSAVYVITAEDIRRSGALTIPDALRLAPGVIVNQSDSDRWAVGIRGFADIFSRSVLVMIDGRSAYTPLVGGVHWAIQDVLLADIDRIEVIRGPGGSIWGANSVNGVINIITRTAGDTAGLRLTGATGSIEHGRAAARFGGSLGGTLDYRVYGKAFTRGGQYHPDGAEFDQWRAGQAGFRTDWRPSGKDNVTLSGDVYRNEAGERAEVSFFSPPSIQTIDGTLNLTGSNLLGRWERQYAGGTRTRLQGYWDRTNRDGFTFGELRNTFDLDFNARLAPIRRHGIAFGAGARFSPSRVTQVVPSLNFLPNEKTNTLASIFGQDDFSVIPKRLMISAGLKLEHNNYTGAEVLPSARVLWTPSSEQSVWAAVTRSVRTPSRFERDLSFQVLIDPATPVYIGVNGNSEFQSETVRAVEGGYRRLVTGNFYVDFAAFHNWYEGLSALAPPNTPAPLTPAPFVLVPLTFQNAVDGTTSGFEITPDWKPLPNWQLKGSYSYLRLAVHDENGFAGAAAGSGYAGMSPHHQVRVQSRIDLPGRFEVDQSYRYVSALTRWSLPAYHAVDARLGWHPTGMIEISVAGQNLFDPHHSEFGDNPVEIRRSFYVQAVVKR
jgi:iron complex outermembrane receptor protein